MKGDGIIPLFYAAMAKRKAKSKKSSGRKRPQKTQVKVLLGALFVLGFLVLSLVFLSQLRESLRPPPEQPKPQSLTPSMIEDVRVELESALLRGGVSSGLEGIKKAEAGSRIDIQASFPGRESIDTLGRRLNRISDRIHIESHSTEGNLLILWSGRILFSLHFSPKVVTPLPLPRPGSPEVAIIVDDMGQDLHTAQTLLNINLNLTLAILPWSQQAPQVDQLLHQAGREILIHIPMEPQSYPATNPGPHALFIDLDSGEIRERFQGYRQRVPHATGGNNHMGSRFTENGEGMRVVLEEMKKADLFFVDSLTTGKSIAYSEALKEGVPAIKRDMFLDNVQESERILDEIRKLANRARQQGYAVGICHPHRETLKALASAEDIFKQQGVRVVPVSKLLGRRSD